MKTTLNLIRHYHRHGDSHYLLNSNIKIDLYINEDNPPCELGQKIIDELAIDFDIDRDEFIEVTPMDKPIEFKISTTKTGKLQNVGVNKPVAKEWADAIHPKK